MDFVFPLPSVVIRILSAFYESKRQVFLVGGAVRDLFQNKSVYDGDFTTNAQPEIILQLFKESFYDNTYGTVRVSGKHLRIQFRLPASSWDDVLFDITTFRTEHGYTDHRRPDKVIWGKDIYEDLSRRDFTINAMALKPFSESRLVSAKKIIEIHPSVNCQLELIDPFSGRVDLHSKLIRTVGNPDTRFNEDALRLMRAIRIGAQIVFQIEEKTLQSIRSNAQLIRSVSWERIRDELLKV